ncbi:MAG: NADH-quinone oxidoreductase subunit L [Anaerolineales bacterium]
MTAMFLQEVSASGSLFQLIPLIVFFPVIGLLINIVFGGRMGEKAVGAVASTASGLAFVIAALMTYALAQNHGEPVVVPFLEWIHIGTLQLDWAFRVDTLSNVMMLVVSGVGTLIHVYAIGYMHEDVRHQGDPKRFRRFFVFLNLFIAMMMILVTGDSYAMLFVGWEGVGLCSYLLIGFWYEKGKDGIGNALAGKKAFIANRVGDFGFLIAMFLTFWAFGSLNFAEVFAKAPEVAPVMPGVVLGITLFMLLGVTGKSAQIPLYVWLPDAMAGPTPVSALIHAATMVTAGVYLVARSAPIFIHVPQAQNTVALVGGLTALFAATIAVGQFDIKKVLAYSTISQLGFMVAAVGMGAFVAGMFHLVTHAFFKALLFLSAGSVIQGMERGEHHVAHHAHDDLRAGKKKHKKEEHTFDPQDMRNMGGLRKQMPVTFWVYLAGAVALAGVPPLAGFWSKDEILLEASHLNMPVYILLTLAAILTAFYMGRQILMVFFGEPRTAPAEHAEESPAVMTVPLIVLAVLSFFGGALNLPGLHTFGHWLEHTFATFEVELEALPFSPAVATLSSVLALAAITGAWMLYGRKPLKSGQGDPLRKLGWVFTGMENKWWVDEIYAFLVVDRYVDLAWALADYVDWQFWHDWFHEKVILAGFNGITRILSVNVDLGGIDRIANGLAGGTKALAARMRRLQTGFVRNYALSVFLGVVLIIGYLMFR